MFKSTLTFVALVLTFDALFYLSQMPGSGLAVNANRFDLGAQWNCAHVIHNPNEVRNELVSRNLEGDHKIIKFIENCIKSVDGWRFKKSDPSRAVSAPTTTDASLASLAKLSLPLTDDMLPYPMRFVLLGELPTKMLPGGGSHSPQGKGGQQQLRVSQPASSHSLGQPRQELQYEAQYGRDYAV